MIASLGEALIQAGKAPKDDDLGTPAQSRSQVA
jgi:hypothetical protein